MRLARRHAERPLISIVPMIDVMLILLIFFMVTSTYLNLDMIPFVEQGENPPPLGSAAVGDSGMLMVRISADGQAHVGGEALEPQRLMKRTATLLQSNPLLSVIIFPSTRSSTQNLVTTMDVLTRAGATRVRLVQIEARP